MRYAADFPFPAARLELAVEVGAEPVTLREYAVVVELAEPDGTSVPKGLINWGYSAPLGGCYQYVPGADAGSLAVFRLPLVAERPIGRLTVKVVSWTPFVPGTDPYDIFGRLVITFSPGDDDDSGALARFTTVRRSTRD